MMGAAAVGEEEERVAADGAGDVRGEGYGACGVMTGGAGMEAAGVGDQGVGHRARLEEDEASCIGGGEDSTFQELSELSSQSRPSRLHQSTIFEMFKAERGCHMQPGEGTSAPIVEEELGSDDDDNADFDMEEEASGEKEDEEEQEAGIEEHPAQVHRGAKRRIHEGVGIVGWSTLLGDRPLEGYRHKPTAMRCFHTIHGDKVHTGGLK